jgi:hypothetical protein
MTVSVNGTTGITFNDASTQNTAATGFGFKNRIINGNMTISQRNGTSSVTPIDNQYTVDRWKAYVSQNSKFSVQQDAGGVTPPVGFTDYLGVTSLSAYSVTSTDYFAITQSIEGFNMADFGYGTASASTVTLSFWVRSSLTGTFGGSLTNDSANYTYPFSYTISAANTWEQKSITITGATTGTWLTTNGSGIQVILSLGAGSTRSGTAGAWVAAGFLPSATGATSVVGTNGATFYITGVQLEKGSTATSFDYRPYGTELALCQRYFQIAFGANGFNGLIGRLYATGSGNGIPLNIFNKVTMRASPTGSIIGTWTLGNCGSLTIVGTSPDVSLIIASATAIGDAFFYPNSASNGYSLSAEL